MGFGGPDRRISHRDHGVFDLTLTGRWGQDYIESLDTNFYRGWSAGVGKPKKAPVDSGFNFPRVVRDPFSPQEAVVLRRRGEVAVYQE